MNKIKNKTEKQLAELASFGGFSNTSKMPWISYSLPAVLCKTGSKLVRIEGSTCKGCYALKGSYTWKSTVLAMHRRYRTLKNPLWVESIAAAINSKSAKLPKSSKFFRWHDSGDIQSLSHLENIAQVAKLCPKIKFWLPTREYSLVSEFLAKNGNFPLNLCVRLSAHLIGKDGPKMGLPTSGVHIGHKIPLDMAKNTVSCEAWKNDNECASCRKCWNNKVSQVSYPKH